MEVVNNWSLGCGVVIYKMKQILTCQMGSFYSNGWKWAVHFAEHKNALDHCPSCKSLGLDQLGLFCHQCGHDISKGKQ